jgi:RNA polymerase sigma-70 factor (ECF subfamily)
LEDEELMDLYKNGEFKAFEVLYGRHQGRVHGYLSKRLPKNAPLDDIFQNIFLKLHKSRKNYDSNYLFLKWLYTLARSELLDYLKKPKMQSEELSEDQMGFDEINVSRDETTEYGHEIDLDSEKKLSANEKQALKLRFISDAEYKEISEKLGVSSSNARKLVSRGIEKLRTKYRGGQ